MPTTAPSERLFHALKRESLNSCCLRVSSGLGSFGSHRKRGGGLLTDTVLVSLSLQLGIYFPLTTDLALARCPNMPSVCLAIPES